MESINQVQQHFQIEDFGTFEGQQAHKITFKNSLQLEATMLDYGATLLSLKFHGKELTLNYVDSMEQFIESNTSYYGATCGRTANRIAGGKFELDGQQYQLNLNDQQVNCLHGGHRGFDKRMWKVKSYIRDEQEIGVELMYISSDGEENYPCSLTVSARYTLSLLKNELKMVFQATNNDTKRSTIVNMCNHAYWNLSGFKTDVKGHVLHLPNSPTYFPVDKNCIPIEETPVAAGAFDFTQPKPVGADISKAGGYDHCFIVDRLGKAAEDLVLHAVLVDPESKCRMTVSSTQPGLQVYTANHLNDSTGRHLKHNAICLETQHFPNSVNMERHRDQTTLAPQAGYRQTVVHAFDA